MPAADLPSFLPYTRKQSESHTVTFAADNGSENETQTVADGETVKKPEDPEKFGYKLLGSSQFSGFCNCFSQSRIIIYSGAVLLPLCS